MQPEFQLTGLEARTSYNIVIYSSNVKGRSKESVSFRVITLPNLTLQSRRIIGNVLYLQIFADCRKANYNLQWREYQLTSNEMFLLEEMGLESDDLTLGYGKIYERGRGSGVSERENQSESGGKGERSREPTDRILKRHPITLKHAFHKIAIAFFNKSKISDSTQAYMLEI